MMKRIKLWYKNLRFRNKVLLSCIAVGLIPITILGFFSYMQMRNLLIDREKQALEETLKQSVTLLEGNLNSYKISMDSLVWSTSLQRTVTAEYDNNYDMYLAYGDVIDPMISNIRNLNPIVEQITIYTSNDSLFPHGDILRPVSEIGIQTEDLKDSKIHWGYSEQGKLELYCKMYSTVEEEQNIIYMRVSDQQTLAHLQTLFDDDYGVFVTDEGNQTIYSYEVDQECGEETYASFHVDELVRTGEYVVKEQKISPCSWSIVLYRPVDAVSGAAKSITILVAVIILLCVVITFLAGSQLSKSVVRPLGRLLNEVKQVEAGNLSVEIREESSDEIGQLIASFQEMVEQLNHMINEVYQSKITQQEYEMKALQAQINPHFLYNSLSLINWKAIMADQTEISEMAQLMSAFYRTTLNKGKNVISVKGEWENVCSYVKIQKMLHSGKFQADMELDKSALEYEMLNLLLQPLVENAIMHGLDHKKTEGEKWLVVRGSEEDGRLIFEVKDNGKGMTEETLNNILTTETAGYGVQNVHHRIQLYYGEDYGLAYESKPDCGTTVRLTIPALKKEDKENVS